MKAPSKPLQRADQYGTSHNDKSWQECHVSHIKNFLKFVQAQIACLDSLTS